MILAHSYCAAVGRRRARDPYHVGVGITACSYDAMERIVSLGTDARLGSIPNIKKYILNKKKETRYISRISETGLDFVSFPITIFVVALCTRSPFPATFSFSLVFQEHGKYSRYARDRHCSPPGVNRGRVKVSSSRKQKTTHLFKSAFRPPFTEQRGVSF